MMKSLLCLFSILTYTSGVIQSNFAHEDNSNGVCTVCTNNVEYCDPTWLPEPNLNYALRGIDITMKRPMPLKPEGDPSFKGLVFNSVFRDTEFGNMQPYDFIHLNDILVCTDEFEEESWKTMDEYIYGTSKSHMQDWSLGFKGPEVEFTVGVDDIFGMTITPPPNSASYGQGEVEDSSQMEAFFNQEGILLIIIQSIPVYSNIAIQFF